MEISLKVYVISYPRYTLFSDLLRTRRAGLRNTITYTAALTIQTLSYERVVPWSVVGGSLSEGL